jgi:hypothetical protein
VQSLNGTWLVAADAANIGRADHWFEMVHPEAQTIPVPGIIQQIFPTHQGVAWYWQTFTPDRLPGPNERALLRFGAVEYLAQVWLNGLPVGEHEGAEMPFELDVTTALREGSNLLAVRVLKPGKERIDGYVLGEIPHRNQYDHAQFQPGMSYNVAGLTGGVALALVPDIHIQDVFAQPEGTTGLVTLHVTFANPTPNAAHLPLRLVLTPAGGGETFAHYEQAVDLPPGETTLALPIDIAHPHAWNLDDPYLYRLSAELNGHTLAIRFGLRDFRVIDGFFHLNGKRVFLRSSHTGNHFPIGQIVPPTPDLMRRDLLMAKAAGFNCVRFIAGAAWPEQLDFCDEIGLMVYEECYASWCLEDSPFIAERYERSYNEMIQRDRNHPSVTMWGLINEMFDGPAFHCAVNYLPKLRELDPTRLVLLASGRWDGQQSIGSVSNPSSREWQPTWGLEAPDAPKADTTFTWFPGGYVGNAGDAHFYPPYPLEERFAQQLRTLGQGTKPVFLSEFGIGSLMNVVEEERAYDRFNLPTDPPDRSLIRQMAQRLQADLKRFGLDQVYPFPADLLRDSYRLHSFQRRLAFDQIRSNPQLVGYNLTGLLDHGISGEGLWSFWRRWKDDIVETLADGWSPLRWCLFVSPPFGYTNQSLELEAVLATEDALAPGEYPVCFRIWGDGKVCWERRAKVTTPAPDANGRTPLAVPVLKTRSRLSLPAGEYTFAADLERGGAPTGDRLPFRVADPATLPKGRGTLLTWGVERRVQAWLEAHGYTCRAYDPADARARNLVLVGDVRPSAANARGWAALRRRMAQEGAQVLLLSSAPFRTRSETPVSLVKPEQLPWGESFQARRFHDWLYHKEMVARKHAAFDGLQAGGILDWYIYDQIISGDVFDCAETPQEVIAASFAAGYNCPGGYDSAVVIGATPVGKGRLVFNALHVTEHVGRHPAADRLLLNLVSVARGA